MCTCTDTYTHAHTHKSQHISFHRPCCKTHESHSAVQTNPYCFLHGLFKKGHFPNYPGTLQKLPRTPGLDSALDPAPWAAAALCGPTLFPQCLLLKTSISMGCTNLEEAIGLHGNPEEGGRSFSVWNHIVPMGVKWRKKRTDDTIVTRRILAFLCGPQALWDPNF